MFQTHLRDREKVMKGDARDTVLFFSIEGVITHSYNDLHIQHCQLISDISWDDEHLCATVFQMNVELALFIMNNLRFFPINRMIIVAEPDIHNSELSMISSERIDPVTFLQIQKNCNETNTRNTKDDSHDRSNQECNDHFKTRNSRPRGVGEVLPHQ